MNNLTFINKDRKLNANIIVHNFLSPDYVYIPYLEDYKLLVKTNEIILKDSIVLSKANTYLYSPISGKVLGITNMLVNNINTKVIVIENDFKEKVSKIKGVKKYINSYTKEELLELLRLFNINENLDGRTLLINGIDNEVYEKTRSATIKKHTNEILEIIDALYNIFNFKKVYLAIKNNDSENVESLIHQIGTYPYINLRMLPDLYPVSYPAILKNKLLSKKDKEPIYLTVEDIYNIYIVLKRRRPVSEKYITISGNQVVTPKIVNVKIGSSIKDIIHNNVKLLNEDYKIIINGLLSGYESTKDLIITKEISSVFLHTKEKDKTTDCINCGMCHTKCPVGADPRSGYGKDKCIKCGTCTYICPAKINFKKGFK